MTAVEQATYDVAVVGCGPSGAVAAALLGCAGLRTFVCDRSRSIYDKPRAIALDHEILRVLQQIGVLGAVMPHVEPFTPSEYFGTDRRLIKRLTMVDPPYPLGHVPSNVFTQPPVEAALRRRLDELPSVTTALGVELTALSQDDAGVTLELRDEAGTTFERRARYAIGCDGASSFVREALGIALDDLAFDEPWLVVDVLANERGLAKLPKTSVQYCHPERPCTLVIGPKNHRRWEISLKEGEDPKLAAAPERTWALLAPWIGPDDGELWRQASYRFHALVASDWRRGRVFIAGDAAHQQPPFLGQGMCQGIRDVANLSWKLAAALRGEVAPEGIDDLLDSYGAERKAHVRELTTRIKGIGAVICERDPNKARERDERLLAECGGVVQDTPRQDVIPALEVGLLSEQRTSGRGKLFPQPRLAEGSAGSMLMDERFGCGWRLVIAADAAIEGRAPLDAAITHIDFRRADVRETEGVVARWMDRHACTAALVRPDHYVFGTAADPAGLSRLIDEWHGRLEPVMTKSNLETTR